MLIACCCAGFTNGIVGDVAKKDKRRSRMEVVLSRVGASLRKAAARLFRDDSSNVAPIRVPGVIIAAELEEPDSLWAAQLRRREVEVSGF